MILKRFPVEYQMDSNDCGPASLKIIAKHFGKFYSLQSLRDKCGITNQGISLRDLSTGAENIGLRALSIKCTIPNVVNKVPFPAIIFWKDSHFIVIYHADKKHVWISDPAKGLIKYSHEEFRAGWYQKNKIMASY